MTTTKVKLRLDSDQDWSANMEENVLFDKPLLKKKSEEKTKSPNYVLGFFGIVTLIVTCSSLYMYHNYHVQLNQGTQSKEILSPTFKWFDDKLRDPVEDWLNTRFGHRNNISPINGLRSGSNPVRSGSSVSNSRTSSPNSCAAVSIESRLDCHPQTNANQEVCEKRGCCWSPKADNSTEIDSNVDIHAPSYHQKWKNLGTPSCFYPNQFKNYNIKTIQSGSDHWIVILEKNQGTESGYPDNVQKVLVEVTALCNKRIRIKVRDAEKSRFEVKLPVLNLEKWPISSDVAYSVDVTDDGVLTITRKSNNAKVVKTDLTQLIFADKFIQLTNNVPSKELFGIGEHLDTFRKPLDGYKRYTMLNTDQAPTKDMPLYGTHPFYMMADDKSSAHGILLFNNHPQDILLNPAPSVTYRTIGGVLDFFVFFGPSFDEVIQQNVQLTSRSPSLDAAVALPPPLWSLGFHLCKYGYKSLAGTRNVTMRTRAAGIPLDVQWNDIDYMIKQNDFTYDPINYKGLPEFVDELHSLGMHYIPIIDPAISGTEPKGTYPPLDDGLEMDIFVKNSTGQLFVGKVWNPESSIFPDFTNPKAAHYWSKQLKSFHDSVKYDGLWLDMNEPSNMIDGQKNGCPNSVLDNPPYLPGGIKLSTKTLCMDAKHWEGNHYDVHNMYGLYENKISNEALKLIRNKRPFIISRATVTGHGQWSNHWTGDVYSDWNSLRLSISALFSFNSFGIPMVGADICGFNHDTTEELCSRWSSLGAFYPFSRNHNGLSERAQDPAFMGGSVKSSARKSLLMKYSLLPYLYTLFYEHSRVGSPVVRPLFYEFPNDADALTETQFLWGSGLMIAPVLEVDARERQVYFPPGNWFNFNGSQRVTFSTNSSDNELTSFLRLTSAGENKTVKLDLDEIGVYVRGGSVIPIQEPKMTTTEQRNGSFMLIVALNENNQANGLLYWDDGDSLDSITLMQYSLINFNVTDNVLTSDPKVTGFSPENGLNVSKINILGIGKSVKSVTLNGKSFNDWKSVDNDDLEINLSELSLLTKFQLSWS